MQKLVIKYFLLLSIIVIAQVANASSDNIVIASCEETYKIEVSKDGESISKVKANKEIVYEATRTAGSALALEFYDDYVKIDKASAPGAKAEYRHWIPEDLFYTDSKVCFLDIPLKEKGKTAKARFNKTYIRGDHFTEIIIPEIYDVRKKTIRIEVPHTLVDRIKMVEKSFQSNITSRIEMGKKGERVYVYEISGISAPKNEEDAPDASVSMPRIYIVGQYPTLNDFYKYAHGLTLASDSASEKVKEQALEITSKCDADHEKIRELVAWVQNHIRYIAVEHGEYGTRPDLASEVLRKRYGDCKGMSTLLKSMLNSVGFDARLVWIGTDEVGTTWSEVPSLASGNHMICAVVEGDSILYIDGTASYLPVGIYSPSIQGREALIENGDSYILQTVPIMPPNVNTDRIKANYIIESNSLIGEVKRELTGVEKMLLNGTYHKIDATKRVDMLSRFICYPKKNVEVNSVVIKGDSIQSLKTYLSANVIEKDACQRVNDKLYVDIMPLRITNVKTYDLKNRKNDVILPYRNRYESEINVKIPAGFEVQSLPSTFDVDNNWFKSIIEYKVMDNEIRCVASIEMKTQQVVLSDLQVWNKVVREFNQANSEQIVLTHK